MTDADLIARAQAGDGEAWEQLISRYLAHLRNFVAQRVTPDDIDDVVATTLIECVRHIHRYEERGRPFSTWMFTIARNRIIDLHRSWHRRQTAPLGDETIAIADVSEAICARLDRQWLWKAVAKLPRRDQRLLRLRFKEDLSLNEVARRTRLSLSQVKTIQHRAIAKLRKELL